MDWRIEWSPAARDDLREVYQTVAADTPRAAAHFLTETLEAIELLTLHCRMGRVVPEFRDEWIREIIRSPYRLVYRIREADRTIDVIRVSHAARGAPRF